MDSKPAVADGRIKGKPTLLVTFPNKLDAQQVLSALGRLEYPLQDVSVYHRVPGTDQVLDATTGQIAAGQALADEDLKTIDLNKLETLVLLHPDGEQFVAVQNALKPFGEADYKYAGETAATGNLEGTVREDERPEEEQVT